MRRFGEVLEAKIHLRMCDLRVLCAATSLETAKIADRHGGWQRFMRDLRDGRWSAVAGYRALNRAAEIAHRGPQPPLWPPVKGH